MLATVVCCGDTLRTPPNPFVSTVKLCDLVDMSDNLFCPGHGGTESVSVKSRCEQHPIYLVYRSHTGGSLWMYLVFKLQPWDCCIFPTLGIGGSESVSAKSSCENHPCEIIHIWQTSLHFRGISNDMTADKPCISIVCILCIWETTTQTTLYKLTQLRYEHTT